MTGRRAAPAAGGSGAEPVPTVFFGTGPFAVPIFRLLAGRPEVTIAAVVTAPDRAAGRGRRLARSAVALAAGPGPWTLLQPDRLRAPESLKAVAGHRPGLIVLADYGQLVPPELVGLPVHGALNVHPSLLPRHRGASPIAAAILAGDAETGVTIMCMDSGLDTGPVVAQERLPLEGTETAPVLEARLADLGAALLGRLLPDWLAGRLEAHSQSADGASLTRPLRREDGRLDWSGSAQELERQVRAYQPWPGSFADSPIGRLTFWRVEPLAGTLGAQAGTVVPEGRGFSVVCGSGWLRIVEIQPAGRRRMTAEALRNGYPGLAGAILG